MRRTTKVLMGSLALLFASGVAVWAQVALPPPETPKPPKQVINTTDDSSGATSLKATLSGTEVGPTVPPVLSDSFAGPGGSTSGFAGVSGNRGSIGGGGASGAVASVERSLRRLTRDLR